MTQSDAPAQGASYHQPIQKPAQRLRGDEVVERVRYRVHQAGWQRVAEEGVGWEA